MSSDVFEDRQGAQAAATPEGTGQAPAVVPGQLLHPRRQREAASPLWRMVAGMQPVRDDGVNRPSPPHRQVFLCGSLWLITGIDR